MEIIERDAAGLRLDEVRAIIREFGFTAHIRARGEEAIATSPAGERGLVDGFRV